MGNALKKKFIKKENYIKNNKQNIEFSILLTIILTIIRIFIIIIVLPFFLLRFYFTLMLKSTKIWLVINLSFLSFILLYLFTCYKTLPDIKKLYEYKPILSSKFYDRNDELIFEVGSEKRAYVNIKDVPQELINAFISAEDKTFYTNQGIDINGIIRTGFQDIYKFIKKQKLGGASTITQQVVKNVLLTNERTLTRKLKEIMLSYRVSKIMSKNKIMEIYLNHIYLGNQTYGVIAAASEYFDKTLSQLTIPEMAMLASLPKAPSGLNPFRNYNRAINRRNWVLLRMKEDGYITEDEYENYKNTDIVVKRKKINVKYPFYASSFFVTSLLSSNEIGISHDKLLKEGYKINLTIDSRLQKISQKALNHSLEQYSKNHGFTGAIKSYSPDIINNKTPEQILNDVDIPDDIGDKELAVVLDVKDEDVVIGLKDNSNGKILLNDLLWAKQKINETTISIKKITKCSDVLKIGDIIIVKKIAENSKYYSLEQIPAINGAVVILNPKTGEILSMIGGYMDKAGAFNRAVQAFRQMGSTIKPFVYATALERGFTPTSIFMDTDININLGNGETWNPSNHNGITKGPVTLRTGLELSKNTVTVRVAEATGLNKIRKTIINSGLNSQPEKNFSIVLGSIESSLIKVVSAFSIFTNSGKLSNTYIIDSIKGSNSDNDYQHIYFSDCDINMKCKINFKKINNKTMQDTTYIDTKENYESDEIEQKTIISNETAYQITNILQGAVKRGTSYKLRYLNVPIASKTGTSNGGKDLWTITFSPDMIIGVYIGYDIPIETNNYGSQYALGVVKEIITEIINDTNFNDFKVPDSIKFVKINKQTGLQTNRELGKDVIFEALRENDEIDFETEQTIEENNEIDITDL